METAIYNVKGQESGKIDLPQIFETKVSKALLHEVITGYLANQRSGTHSTKTRGEVSGGGRKPWREKGTGNARSGSNRSPLWRKGGIIFGPQPRSYYQSLSQQKRRKSLYMALSSKLQDGNLMVVENLSLDEPKTKKFSEILKNLKVNDTHILLVLDKVEKNLKLAGKNIQGLVITEAKNINAYEVMWAKKVLLTPAAVEQLNLASGTGANGKQVDKQ